MCKSTNHKTKLPFNHYENKPKSMTCIRQINVFFPRNQIFLHINSRFSADNFKENICLQININLITKVIYVYVGLSSIIKLHHQQNVCHAGYNFISNLKNTEFRTFVYNCTYIVQCGTNMY